MFLNHFSCCACDEELCGGDNIYLYNGGRYCEECFAAEVGCDLDEVQAYAAELGAQVLTANELEDSERADGGDWAYGNYRDESLIAMCYD